MWADIASTWAVIGAVWAVTSSMWAVTASMCDVQALCGLLHPLTLTLTIIRVQCTGRKPNPTIVATTRPKRWRIAANLVRLGFLDTVDNTGNVVT